MKLVIHPPLEESRLLRIVDAAGAMQVVNATDEQQALREIGAADGFYGKMTPQLLSAAGANLRWVQSPTASLEHYIFPELVDHPLQLTNMRGLYGDVIADHVMGYVICLARNFPFYIRNQTESKWEAAGGEAGRAGFLTGPGVATATDHAHIHLSDTTMGIIGLGQIGAEIGRRAAAFSIQVIAVDPLRSEPPEGIDSLWKMDRLDDLLAQSDWVVVAAPHTPETERMIAAEQFQKMKSSAYFINIGRGAIVVLDDLVAALEQREIQGAALDVYEVEPLPADHPLWTMPNVLLTPHIAACSPRISERHTATLLDNVRRFATGEDLRNVVDKAKWF